jgi:adenylate cyclase
LAWRRNDLKSGEELLRRAITTARSGGDALDAIVWQYALRDLLHGQGRTAEAVHIMNEVLDELVRCGSERGSRDVEEWLRPIAQASLVRLALSRHVPDHMLEDILNGKLTTVPPRAQQVAVLFSDIRGYTALTERCTPAEVLGLLNEWLVEVTRVIRKHGGWVNQIIGDAIMALFGVPSWQEEAPANAVRAALDLRDSLAAFNLRRQALKRPTIRIGIGIHTGAVVVGFVGSHLRQTFTAVGDVTNTAARLQDLTKEENVDMLISHEVEQVQQRWAVAETSFLGERKLKGREKPALVYAVLGGRRAAAQG